MRRRFFIHRRPFDPFWGPEPTSLDFVKAKIIGRTLYVRHAGGVERRFNSNRPYNLLLRGRWGA